MRAGNGDGAKLAMAAHSDTRVPCIRFSTGARVRAGTSKDGPWTGCGVMESDKARCRCRDAQTLQIMNSVHRRNVS